MLIISLPHFQAASGGRSPPALRWYHQIKCLVPILSWNKHCLMNFIFLLLQELQLVVPCRVSGCFATVPKRFKKQTTTMKHEIETDIMLLFKTLHPHFTIYFRTFRLHRDCSSVSLRRKRGSSEMRGDQGDVCVHTSSPPSSTPVTPAQHFMCERRS